MTFWEFGKTYKGIQFMNKCMFWQNCQWCWVLFHNFAGNFCTVCLKCYPEHEFDMKMMQCARCAHWVHPKCEGLTGEWVHVYVSGDGRTECLHTVIFQRIYSHDVRYCGNKPLLAVVTTITEVFRYFRMPFESWLPLSRAWSDFWNQYTAAFCVLYPNMTHKSNKNTNK